MRNRVIYVAGYGRSGSTVVDIALGMHAEIFGAGEISAMCRHAWRENEFCACGERLQDCSVWGPIMARWTQDIDPEEYFSLQRAIEPLFAPARMFGGRQLSGFLAQSREMFSAIRAQTGASIILDSSKAPGRALAFLRDSSIDLRVIHLVRDARAVAHAMGRAIPMDVKGGVQKQIIPRSPIRSALRWRMYNSRAERLGARVRSDRFVRVRYEDFARDPVTEMARISAAIGIDLAPIAEQIAAGAPIVPGHQMAGSRMRMMGPVALRYNDSWAKEMPEAAQHQVVRIARSQLKRYGYID